MRDPTSHPVWDILDTSKSELVILISLGKWKDGNLRVPFKRAPVGIVFSVKWIAPLTPVSILNTSPLTLRGCRFPRVEIQDSPTQKHPLLGTTRQQKDQVASTHCHRNGQNPSLAMLNPCNAPLRKQSLPQRLREHGNPLWGDCPLQSHVEAKRPVKWTTC